MRIIWAKLFIAAAITALVAFGADNSLGTWKLNVDKSMYTPGPPLKNLTITREAAEGGVKVTWQGERADGTPVNFSYTAKYDGRESAVTGAPFDTISLKHANANTWTSTVKKTGGKYNGHSRTVISKDGKIMTITSKGTNEEGKAFSATYVLDKD